MERPTRNWHEEWAFLHGNPPLEVPQLTAADISFEISDPDCLCRRPLVSILTTIWNHEKWLDECIGSMVNQKTDFEYEILLCEDWSTDSSRQICKSWQERYPDKIRILFGENNLGVWKNCALGAREARGRYLACLEGDDYWTDSLKLQKQVDLMRSGGYRAVVAWNDVLEERSGKVNTLRFPILKEIVLGRFSFPYYHTSTYLFEKILREEMLPYLNYVKAYDTVFIRLALSLAGRIGILNEKVSVYRKTGMGIYTGAALSDKGEDGVRDAVAFLRVSPKNLLPLARHNYCSALFNYVIYSNYGGRRSIKLWLAFCLALMNITFKVNTHAVLFLAASAVKSFLVRK